MTCVDNCLSTGPLTPAWPPVHSTYRGQSTRLRKLRAFLLLKIWVLVCPRIRLKLLSLAPCSPGLSLLFSLSFTGYFKALLFIFLMTRIYASLSQLCFLTLRKHVLSLVVMLEVKSFGLYLATVQCDYPHIIDYILPFLLLILGRSLGISYLIGHSGSRL